MDLVQDWAHQLLGNDYTTYLPYAYRAYGYVSILRGWMLLLVDQVSNKPDLATIALVLVILFVSLKILNMLWQTVMFWFKLAWTLVFWGGLAVLGLWMYSRGPEGMGDDVGYWMSVWTGEYEHWKEREQAARMVGGRGGRGGTKGWF